MSFQTNKGQKSNVNTPKYAPVKDSKERNEKSTAKTEQKPRNGIKRASVPPNYKPKNKIERPKLLPNFKPKNKIGRPKLLPNYKPKNKIERPKLLPNFKPKNKIGRPKLLPNYKPKNKIGRPKLLPNYKPKNKIERPKLPPNYKPKNKIERPKLQPNFTPKNKINDMKTSPRSKQEQLINLHNPAVKPKYELPRERYFVKSKTMREICNEIISNKTNISSYTEIGKELGLKNNISKVLKGNLGISREAFIVLKNLANREIPHQVKVGHDLKINLEKNEKMAEFTSIILGDGNITCSKGNYRLDISLNNVDEVKYVEYIKN